MTLFQTCLKYKQHSIYIFTLGWVQDFETMSLYSTLGIAVRLVQELTL